MKRPYASRYQHKSKRQKQMRVAGNLLLALAATAVAAVVIWVFLLG
jgi:hypothetical protein